MPLDAERVGEAQRDAMPGTMRNRSGGSKGFLRPRRIEQITFEIADLGGTDQLGVEVLGAQLDAGAEIGRHGALPVGRDTDQAPRRAGAGGRRRGVELHPDRAEVVAENLAEEVVAHLADIAALAAERGDPGHRVAGGAAGTFDGRPHFAVERLGALGVDQRHRAFR